MQSDEHLYNTGINIHMSIARDEFICLLSVRLREERRKQDKKQSELAEICGVTVRTWGKYENAETMPDAYVLFELLKQGLDVNYILTGERQPISTNTETEQKIITQYRKADVPVKFAVENLLDALGL